MTVKVISFGEILCDVINEKEYIGGASFIVAAHLVHLQLDSYLVSRIG